MHNFVAKFSDLLHAVCCLRHPRSVIQWHVDHNAGMGIAKIIGTNGMELKLGDSEEQTGVLA